MGFDHKIMEWVQALGGSEGSAWQKIMDVFFACCTFLCEETFLLIAIFIIYWAVNKKFGVYLVMTLFASMGINGLFKSIVARPRPFLNSNFNDLRYVEIDNFFVNTTELSTSYSFPSGHAQLAGSLFSSAALFYKRRWLTIVTATLILLVMASRVYLGVHYPTDVIVGGIIGVGIAFIMNYVMKKFENKNIIILLILFGIVFLTFIFELIMGSSSAGGTAKMVGLAAGAIAGFIFDDKKINFSVEGVWWKKVLRVAIGFAIVMGVRLGLKPLYSSIDNAAIVMLCDAIRYGLMGLIATAIWPYIFTKLKL